MDDENEVIIKGSKKWSLISIAVTILNIFALYTISGYLQPRVLFIDNSRTMIAIVRGAGIVWLIALILAVYGAKREWPHPIFAVIAFILCAFNFLIFLSA
jgi:hypothetical protein